MAGSVTVVGLGPAGPELVTTATLDAIARHEVRLLRTRRHPSASLVGDDAESFDALYDKADRIEDVYVAIVEAIVARAARDDVLYCVPGSPAVAERTVEILRADPRVHTTVVPALSCIDLAWSRLGVDPLAAAPKIVDGHRFAVDAAGELGPMLVLQCDRPSVLAEIKLAIDNGRAVTVLHHLGLPDERIETVPWASLDRVEPDHLTTVWVPRRELSAAGELVAFDELVRTLRERCPWDRAQTHESLRPYVIEEAYEVVDAIDSGDPELLEEELGDLLFQVVFHSVLAAERGEFALADVARTIHDKLVRRHPHVFGGEPVGWDELKRLEKNRTATFDGVPAGLPALAYATALQQRARKAGFDWAHVDDAWPKVDEEIAELRAAAPDDQSGELGDLLFACVNVARHLGLDAEVALRGAATKFRRRFEAVERLAGERDLPLPGTDLTVLDGLWDEVKRAERDGA